VLVDGKNTSWPRVLTVEAYLKATDAQATLNTLTDKTLSRTLQPITSLAAAVREYRAIFVRNACARRRSAFPLTDGVWPVQRMYRVIAVYGALSAVQGAPPARGSPALQDR